MRGKITRSLKQYG